MISTTIAVLGLGEAGAAFAADLARAGAQVRGYDPAVQAVDGVIACRDEADAVRGAELILSLTAAAPALSAFRAAAEHIEPGAVWADLNTAQPLLKRTLDSESLGRGTIFADIAIMAPVPGRGLATPMLASGRGAQRAAALLANYGATVSVLEGPAGAAAERKLLRSVFYKGMSAAVVEALAAAEVLGLRDWLAEVVTNELKSGGPQTVPRIVDGTTRHAARRADEMEAAAKMLADLGVDHDITDASAILMHRIVSLSRSAGSQDLDT